MIRHYRAIAGCGCNAGGDRTTLTTVGAGQNTVILAVENSRISLLPGAAKSLPDEVQEQSTR